MDFFYSHFCNLFLVKDSRLNLFFFLFSFNSWKVCQIMIAFPVAFARLDKRESTKPQMSRSVMFNAFVFSVLKYFIFCQILQMNTISTISFIFGIIERRMIFSHNFHSKFNKFLRITIRQLSRFCIFVSSLSYKMQGLLSELYRIYTHTHTHLQ